jgi:hypothetical protein
MSQEDLLHPIRRFLMKKVLLVASALLLVSTASYPGPDPAPDAGKPTLTWQNVVSNVLARPGTLQPGEVYVVGIPRTDLKVTVRGVTLEPSFALTSQQTFRSAGKGSEILVRGDLLVLPEEVNPVMSQLIKGGFQITALHNHLVGESPRLMDIHYEGKGASGPLSAVLRDALAQTGVPRYETAADLLATDPPPPAVKAAFDQVETILGQEGTISRKVLQFLFPRRDPVRSGNAEIPPAMGTCACLAFQSAGGPGSGELAATGELVVVQEELTPVLQALRMGGMDVAAIHDTMMGEQPQLKYVHFWGKGTPEEVGTALRAALDQIALKR